MFEIGQNVMKNESNQEMFQKRMILFVEVHEMFRSLTIKKLALIYQNVRNHLGKFENGVSVRIEKKREI
jgi:hypothetical protein